jgi:hypothetical protein
VQVIRQPERIRIEHVVEEEPMSHEAPMEARTFEPEDRAAGESPVGRLLALHSVEREATAARVANLFPAPETTEWNVREISYDRTRRSQAQPHAS